MPFWILTAAVIVVIGGFAYAAYRAGRGRPERGGDVWIGGHVSGSDYDSSSVGLTSADSGRGGSSDFEGGGGDFGGGGASGGWVSDSGGGDSGGGDGGGDGGGGGGGD
ncbi:MAG TPA: hypothetical protein VES64_02760 [Allosphingosinicella sp.]|nr:hypothetical protein [Allosphingosinicella sp.]